MSYTGSYRNRTAASLHQQDAKAAVDLESQRKGWVADAKSTAKDWKSEQARLNKLRDIADYAEAQQLGETWKAASQAIQKGVVPLVQSKWEEAINQGMVDFQTGGEAWDKRVEEVQNLDTKVDETQKQVAELAKKAPLDTYRNDILGRGPMWRIGYQRGRLQSALAGFGTHRLNTLATSTDILKDANGNQFELKNYRDAANGYEIASDHIRRNFLLENRGTLNANYIAVKAIPVLSQVENNQKSEYYRNLRVQEAEERIVGYNIELSNTAKTGTVEDLTNALVTHNLSVIAELPLTNPRSGVGQEYHTRMQAVIKELAEANLTDENLERRLIEALSKAKIKGHGAGEKTLSELYPSKYGAQTIRNIFTDAKAAQARRLNNDEKNTKAVFENQILEDRASEFSKGQGFSEEYKRTVLKEASAFGFGDKEWINKIQSMLSVKPMDDAVAYNFLKAEAGGFTTGGQLSTAVAEDLARKKGISPQVIEDLKAKNIIVDNPFATGEEGLTAAYAASEKVMTQAIKEQITRLKGHPGSKLNRVDKKALSILLTSGIQGTGNKDIDTLGGVTKMAQELWLENQKLLEQGLGDITFTKVKAVENATNMLLERFELLNEGSRYNKHQLYVGTKEGFKNLNLTSQTPFFKNNERRKDISAELLANIQEGGLTKLLNTPYSGIRKSDFDINRSTGSRPSQIFDMAAAADETDKHSPWDIRNQWLEVIKNDESHPLYEWANAQDRSIPEPANVSALKERISGPNFYALTNWGANKAIRLRVLNEGGIAYTQNLNQVITKQEVTERPAITNEQLNKQLGSPLPGYNLVPDQKITRPTGPGGFRAF